MSTHKTHPSTSPLPDAVTTDDEAPRYTKAQLQSALGAPAAADTELYGVRAEPSVLREMGAELGSPRIWTDGLRMTGQAHEFVESNAALPAAQRVVIRGFSPGLLRVLFAELVRLDGMVEQHESHGASQSTALAGLEESAKVSRKAAMDLREELRTSLTRALRDDRAKQASLAAALGTASDHGTLHRSLSELTKLARSLAAQNRTVIAKRLAAGNVDEEWLAAIDAASAKALEDGAKVSSARSGKGTVTQAELDVQDGVVLSLLEELMDLFNTAHRKHPSVPHLTPNATRSFFHSYRAKHAAPVAPPAAPESKPEHS